MLSMKRSSVEKKNKEFRREKGVTLKQDFKKNEE